MSSGSSLVPYDPGDTDAKALYERACSTYLEILEETGKSPRLQAVAERLLDNHANEYPSVRVVLGRLDRPEFQEELRLRRKEHLLSAIGPRLLMAEMAAGIGKEATEEMMARLRDPEKRSGISSRDLNSIIKTASDLSLAVDKDLEQVAQSAPVNKGTIIQLFAQLAPERAAVVMAELARQATAKERNDA
jgi:hypothetical protein